MLGAMIGIERSNNLGDMYSKEYLDMYRDIHIGIRLDSAPKKVTFFTNHRSLKRGKKPDMKPFKVDLVDKPKYTIYVEADDNPYSKKLSEALQTRKFTYSPYLGHAYCPATVAGFETINGFITEPYKKTTQCVVLDESETYNTEFRPEFEIRNDGGTMIVERHKHHFFEGDKFDARVLKHWIPTPGTDMKLINKVNWTLSKFYSIGDRVVCIY